MVMSFCLCVHLSVTCNAYYCWRSGLGLRGCEALPINVIGLLAAGAYFVRHSGCIDLFNKYDVETDIKSIISCNNMPTSQVINVNIPMLTITERNQSE